MSTESSPSPESIEQTKQQIRGLVNEISQLSKSDMGPDEYYPQFLTKIIQALAAVGGAVWLLGDGRRPFMQYQINVSETLLDDEGDDAVRHGRLLNAIINSKEAKLIPPLSASSDERAGANPTRFLLVVAPLQADGEVEGLIEIFQRSESSPATQRGYMKFLVQMCELANEWLKSHKLRSFSDRHTLWSQADQFARLVHESLDLRETAYTVVNEGRRMIGCDRVSLAIKRGSKCIVEAISGQDSIESRSNIVASLNKLATTVVMTGEPLWYTGSTEDFPPQVEQAVEQYVDESYAKTVAVLPVRRPKDPGQVAREQAAGQVEREGSHAGEIIGALIVEQLESDLPHRMLESRMDLVFEHSARALSNALDHNNLFLMPLWKAIGSASWIVRGRNLPKALTISAAALILLIGSLIIPTDFEMKAKGELKPVDRRDVFVEVAGDVIEVNIQDGKRVNKGDLLAVLRNSDLDVQMENVRGELSSATSRVKSLILVGPSTGRSAAEARDSTGVDILELRAKISSLTKQLELLADKKERLKIKSPANGVVMLSWDVEKSLLHRPVTEGQVLMTIANPDSDWELELHMPERRMKHVAIAQAEIKPDLPIEFILASNPGVYHQATVQHVHKSTELHQTEGHTVRIRATISPEEQARLENPRPGTTVTAKVYAGRSSFAYSWFHEALAWVEENVIFPFFG